MLFLLLLDNNTNTIYNLMKTAEKLVSFRSDYLKTLFATINVVILNNNDT